MIRNLLKISGMLLVLFVALFLLVGIGQLMIGNLSADSINLIDSKIKTLGFYTQFIRWFLYAALYFYWVPIIHFLSGWKKWEQHVVDRALKSKLSSLIILIGVELFIIQTIHVKLFHVITG